MPRTESRTPCSIWDKRNWTSLPIDCQWFYLMLRSQYGVSHAGILQIPRREWTNLASDDNVAERIAHARKLCEDRGYIAVDENTDEVLIRTYIRNDVMAGPPGTFRASMDAACAVRSPKLRAILRGELLRLDAGEIEAKGAKVHREKPLDAYHRALAALGHGPGGGQEEPAAPTEVSSEDGILMPSSEPVDSPRMPSSPPAGCHPDAIVDAPVVVDVAVDGSSEVGSSVESKEAAAPRAGTRELRDANVRAARLVVATLPRALGNYVTREALQTRLGERLALDDVGELTDHVVSAALTRWVKTSKVAPAAIDWMLDDAIKESQGATAPKRGNRTTTDDIFAAGTSLVAKYEAEEAAAEGYASVHRIHRGAS